MTEVDLGAPALVVVFGAGLLSSLATLWVFRRWSDSRGIGRAINRILAHLLEFQLFLDEPALILRAQCDLVLANMRLLKLLIKPSLILAIPFTLLLAGLEQLYGHAPLVVGEPAVVTVETAAAAPSLHVPAGIHVETAGVRVPSQGQVSWRLRPVQATTGELNIAVPGRVLTKSISAGPGLRAMEMPFTAPIQIQYPPATILHAHWLVWFLAGSLAGPLVGLRAWRRAATRSS